MLSFLKMCCLGSTTGRITAKELIFDLLRLTRFFLSTLPQGHDTVKHTNYPLVGNSLERGPTLRSLPLQLSVSERFIRSAYGALDQELSPLYFREGGE